MEEEEYLQLIEQKLADASEKLIEEMSLNDKDIAQLQELYWENLSDFDEYGYEEYENRMQMFNYANAKDMNLKTLRVYQKMQDSPYFARVDFLFDGDEAPECCYIGIGNFSDEKGGEPLIYDWRAPISSLFYDYDKGRASYEAPAGTVEGEIIRKFQYKIKKGKLIYVVESDIKIDDDILKQALSASADARLKSIVSTIQKEQNSIIRNEKDRILIVQGGAGSGKTSVALHRIAYLLYRHREELKASQVLILSPNDVFSDYISHILPELGEENISEMMFDDYAAKELKDVAETESHYDFLEDVLIREMDARTTQTAADRRKKLVYRGSRDFVQALNGYVLELEGEIMEFKNVTYKKLSKSADEIARLFYNGFPDIPLFKRMDAVREYVVDEYTTLTGHELDDIEAAIVKDKFDSLYITRDLYRIYSDFLESIGEEPLIGADDENGAKSGVNGGSAGSDANNGGADLASHKEKNNLDAHKEGMSDGTRGARGEGFAPEKRRLGYEDVYPVLYLKYLLYGKGNDRRIKHLIIDEMQDYSYLQYCIIHNVFNCPMTILGDKEQSIDSEKSDVLRILPEIMGKNAKCIVLNKSYRSTVEITEYAAAIAGIENIQGIDRHGETPKQNVYEDEGSMMAAILENIKDELSTQSYETIAVLCKTQAEAEYYGDILEDYLDDVTVLDKDTDRFRTGVVVAPFYLAKGLEFDCVHIIGVDNDSYYSAYHKQLLYIGATRALHRLAVYGVGEECMLLGGNQCD